MKYRNIRYAQLQGKRRQACPNLQSVNVGSMRFREMYVSDIQMRVARLRSPKEIKWQPVKT